MVIMFGIQQGTNVLEYGKYFTVKSQLNRAVWYNISLTEEKYNCDFYQKAQKTT